MKFIFDLDGTLTNCETLPAIAKKFGFASQIDELTAQTVQGQVPFIESFIKRVNILGKIEPKKVAIFMASIELNQGLLEFINNNSDDCIIATGNYRGWVQELAEQFKCPLESSEGELDSKGHVRLTKILKKEDIVRRCQSDGEPVVFIGDGNNDAEAMRLADISIACGLLHQPALSVMQVADYAVFDSEAILRLLNQIKKPQPGKSIVISAAGIGSRLGLGQTKSLIKVQGRSLISLQLDHFSHIQDIRVVVGFQAISLIHEICSLRKDVIFVFNHDYFHTKTGTSLYLGSKHANELIFAWDGDLLVHPDDVKQLLGFESEVICVSERTSDESVNVILNESSQAICFTREDGDYEWTGPAIIRRINLRYTSSHVFSLLEPLLPMPTKLIRAQDIDTYDDYKKAIHFVNSWSSGNHNIDSYYKRMSMNISRPQETRNNAPDFSDFDIELVKRFASKDLSLLDLGSGTGLLVNHFTSSFSSIVAVEKYSGFSAFIAEAENLQIINDDLNAFNTTNSYDLVTLFGVMNYFSSSEAKSIYRKARLWTKPGGRLIVKHQMGIDEDVYISGFSEELGVDYYSEYRWLHNEIALICSAGFEIDEVIDIYPSEFNRWDNTHFYALVCK